MIEYVKKQTAKQIICDFCNQLYPDEPCEPSDCDWMEKLDTDTIRQLAALSGVSANAIGGLERGKRISGQYMTIEVLADALGLSVDEYTGHRRRASNVTQKDCEK